MTSYDVVKKLIGEIAPQGETNIDQKRLENLKEMTELVDQLLTDISLVAAENRDRQEASMKEAGEFATKFLHEYGIPNHY